MRKLLKIVLLLILFYLPKMALAASITVSCTKSVTIGDTIECTVTGHHTTLAGLKAEVSYSGMEYINVNNLTGSNMFVVSNNQLDGAFDIANSSKTLAKYTFKASVVGTAKLSVSCQQIIDGTDFSSVDCSSANQSITINNVESEETPVIPNIPVVSKNNDATLKAIDIDVGNIEFESNKYSYDLEVDYSVEQIEIVGIPNDSRASVELEGDTKLNVGDNVFKINVVAEDGVTKKIYIINILRSEKLLSTNNKVNKITINNYDFNFVKTKKEYDLTIGNEDYLSIDVDLEDEFAKYEIIGNKNLKNGSLITINIIAEDGSINTYTINIIKPKNKASVLSKYLIISIILNFFTAVVLVFVVEKYNSSYKKITKNVNI